MMHPNPADMMTSTRAGHMKVRVLTRKLQRRGCMWVARLDDQGAAAHALEAAAGIAHAQRGLQSRDGRHAPSEAPSVPALDELRHPPACL